MEKLVRLDDKTFRLFKSETEITASVRQLANRINNDYVGKRPLLVPVLNGAFMFASDLMKELKLDCEVSFIKTAAYRHGDTPEEHIRTIIGLSEPIRDRHVILVEDIIDTGRTIAQLLPLFRQEHPASLKIVALLLKPFKLQTELAADYVGLEIPDAFVVGYGLDYKGLGRNLRDIYQAVLEGDL